MATFKLEVSAEQKAALGNVAPIVDLLTSLFNSEYTNDGVTHGLIESFMFQGFDWKGIIKKLQEKGMSKNDFETLCALFVTRGPAISDSALNRLPDDARTHITTVVKKLDLVQSERPQKSTDLTVARIIAVAPMQAAMYMKKYPTQTRAVGYKPETHKIERWLCFPQAASMIPVAWTKRYGYFKEWFVAQSKLLVQRSDKKGKVTNPMPAEDYADLSHKSDLFNEPQRIAIMKAFGLTTDAA
jgi:hypothetical protein